MDARGPLRRILRLRTCGKIGGQHAATDRSPGNLVSHVPFAVRSCGYESDSVSNANRCLLSRDAQEAGHITDCNRKGKIDKRPVREVMVSEQVVSLPDGTPMIVRVSAGPGAQDVSLGRSQLLDFDEVQKAIAGMGQVARQALTAVAPTTATVEFKVGLRFQAGRLLALLAEGEGDAALKVTLTWGGATDAGEAANAKE